MKNKVVKIFFIIVLFISCCQSVQTVNAETLNSMEEQLSKLKNELSVSNSNKKLTESQLDSLKNEIATINANITKARSDIKVAEKKIADSEEEIQNKKDECDQMLQTLQLSNSDNNTYLEYIFEADSYTDMIYRYAIVSQMTNYNNKVMDELNTLVNNLQQEKVELTSKQKDLESQQASLGDKLVTLNANLKELTTEGTDIETDIKDLEKQIKLYKNTYKCSGSEQISTCINRYNNSRNNGSTGVLVNAKGWTYPLMRGTVTSEYTNGVREDWTGIAGYGHYGIDLGVSEGTNVYPAAPGYVARITFSNCGGNQVYIYHTVNGVNYTTAYLHLLKVNVSVGQTVTTNTVIALSGGYSTATAHGGYDRCTTGGHLHFGVANGQHATGFSSYSFNPRNILSFPARGAGSFSR